MAVGEVSFLYDSYGIDVAEIEVLAFGTVKYGLSFGRIQELALFVEQFKRIPLFMIMLGGEYDAYVGLFEYDCHFRGRC